MAKRSSEPASSDKAKVRVFFAEVEGNNESVQEALRTMVSAMTRPVRVVAEQRLNGKAPSLLRQPDAEDIEDAVDQAEQVEEDSIEDSAAAAVRKPRGTGKKVDRNAGLELVPDLNFRPGGKQTFKAFVDDKKPKNDREVALAAIYYMQKIMGLTKIGARHVMTAFKEAGIAVPVDVRQTIRNVKNTSARLSFTDMEDIRTTTQGENFVEHDMGKTD
jgi:hypothetical protein